MNPAESEALAAALRQKQGSLTRHRTTAALVALFVAVNTWNGACAQQSQTSGNNAPVTVTYTRSGQVETVITIAGSELTRTVTTCHSPETRQSCQDPTVESVTAKLKSREVKKLIADIQASGFFKLEDAYGTRNFSYAQTITVKIGGKSRSVVYRAGSDALPAPEAFAAVEEMIDSLAAKSLPPARDNK